MINEKLLRENGNLKDLVVQTSADLEREKSNQDNLVHHNELINSDNAALHILLLATSPSLGARSLACC